MRAGTPISIPTQLTTPENKVSGSVVENAQSRSAVRATKGNNKTELGIGLQTIANAMMQANAIKSAQVELERRKVEFEGFSKFQLTVINYMCVRNNANNMFFFGRKPTRFY